MTFTFLEPLPTALSSLYAHFGRSGSNDGGAEAPSPGSSYQSNSNSSSRSSMDLTPSGVQHQAIPVPTATATSIIHTTYTSNTNGSRTHPTSVVDSRPFRGSCSRTTAAAKVPSTDIYPVSQWTIFAFDEELDHLRRRGGCDSHRRVAPIYHVGGGRGASGAAARAAAAAAEASNHHPYSSGSDDSEDDAMARWRRGKERYGGAAYPHLDL
ncbi:MAG: hypothetical protein M1838_004158 [Thelocarpon superellum]|nr:MAG: hypothetical protein M1838_004158 [Thelocarpon superellum]